MTFRNYLYIPLDIFLYAGTAISLCGIIFYIKKLCLKMGKIVFLLSMAYTSAKVIGVLLCYLENSLWLLFFKVKMFQKCNS